MQQIQVISRDAIPSGKAAELEGELHEPGKLKDFRWNAALRSFMPEASRFSVSWVQLAPGERFEPQVHPVHSMMVFYRGAGQMLGDLSREVEKDDVVVVPAGCAYGFVGGPGGLFALSIQFGESLHRVPEAPKASFTHEEACLEALREHNEMRRQDFAKRAIFELLADGTLDDSEKRKAYHDALQIWADGNHALLGARQESRVDPASARDAVMEAITNWFTQQMHVLGDIEKAAIVHLVLESVSKTYRAAALPTPSELTNQACFDVNEEHARTAQQLLKDESALDHARLRKVVDEAWDMIGALTDRVVELTRLASSACVANDVEPAPFGSAARVKPPAELIERVVIVGNNTTN